MSDAIGYELMSIDELRRVLVELNAVYTDTTKAMRIVRDLLVKQAEEVLAFANQQ